jgi:hypothetical protein
MRKADGWLVRFVLNGGKEVPAFATQSIQGTLEDAYLHCIDISKKEAQYV